MKKIISVALAAASFVAAPAMAQDTASPSFTGPRVGINAGFYNNDFAGFDEFSYGAEAGYDIAAGNAVFGITGEIQDSKEISRELALTARAGTRVGSNGLLYATGGYSNLKAYGIKLDGYKVGVGGEFGIGRNAYAKVEQLYNNYERGVDGWQTRVGAGIRF